MEKTNFIRINEVIPDTHTFIYKNKKYPFKFDYFKYASDLFSRNQKEYEETKIIKLLDSEEEKIFTISDGTIKDFINYVQCEKIILTKENVLDLNYLSRKLEVSELSEQTSQFISEYHDELVLDIQLRIQNEQNYTYMYEGIISEHLDKYLDDERLSCLPIQTLYRILKKSYFLNPNQSKGKIFDFLFKCIDKHGRKASILFDSFDFGELSTEIMMRLITNYSDVFDFSFLKNTMTKTILEQYQKLAKYEETISKQTKENDDLKQQIKTIQNENEQMQIQLLTKEQEKNKLKDEISQLKEQINQKNKIEEEEQIKLKYIIQNLENISNKQQEKIENQTKIIQDKMTITPLLYNKKDRFNGIINYLTNKTGGNIYDNGTINVTCSSHYPNREPKNLLDFNENVLYVSKQNNDTWVCFDFKDMKAQITNYSIKSNSHGPNCGHLKSWNIEVSNDGIQWTIIDERKNCQVLNGSCITETFDVKTNDFSRYVRFHQTDEAWDGKIYYLGFYYLEFFGYLKQ